MRKLLQYSMILTTLMVAVGISESFAQFFPHNDTTVVFAATTNGFGRIQTYDGGDNRYTDGNDKMIDRLYQVVGHSADYVWNTNDDPDVNIIDTVYYAGADSSEYYRELVMDNSFRSSPPFDINVNTLVRQFKDEPYALSRLGVTNVDASPKTFKFSVMVRAKIQNVFGNETLEYNETTKRFYAFTSSGAIGVEILTGDLKGVSLLDFGDYDSTEPERDNARDSYRWDEMVKETFPTSNLTAGVDGGFTYLNFGDTPELATNENYSVWIAFTHGADLDVVDDRLDQAVAKYSEITTSAELPQVGLPTSVQLHANFPNPFNPSTEISYTLAQASQVRLEVFNMLGQSVANLVDGVQSAGTQTVTFNAAGLPSGMYLYRLTTPTTSITKKMMLLK